MALSKLQKGLVGLGIAVVAVIAVGYGGMRYLENAVVDAIRTWAAQTPQDAHVELGDISYTLMDNHLVLKNVRMTYVTPAKQTVAATVETLDIRNPGTTLLSLMRDPKSEIKEAELPVADEIALHNLSFGPEPNITVRLRTFKGVAIETAAVKTLMSTAGDDDPKVALAIIYGLSYKEDSASGVKITSKALPFSLSTDSAVQKSYAKGHLDSSVTNGIVFTLRGQDVLTLGEIRLENMNLPPRDIMEKIYFIAPTDINDDEAFGIFQNFFAGPKPLIGVFSLKDLKTSSALLDVSLDKLNITNPSTSPYALEVSLEHLKMPVALVPELQLLSVMGVPEIDASASYAMSLPNKDNQFNSTASLSVAKLGTADFAVKGEFPYEEFLEIVKKTKSVDDPATEDAIENFVEKNIKFSHIEAGYADEGLLPRLGILADHNVDAFFAELDKMVDLVFEQLLERLEIQSCKKCKNYPFLMGQGIWIDSERLGPDDEVREVLKHGTLTVGFIGLAECLKALIGKHHGESEEAQELGLKIVGFIREKADKKAAETKLNFSVIATPAEGLSGKFVRLDRKRFGSIEGITDKDYYTNSFHIPVYYSISAYNKIRLEAPYHAMTNGGHITYVEVDGDPVNNLEAFEDLIRAMKDMGVGYGSINHPVDRDPLCGYTGIIGDVCPRCGRHDGEGVDIEVLRKIKGYIRDVRSEEERLEAEDKMPNMVI